LVLFVGGRVKEKESEEGKVIGEPGMGASILFSFLLLPHPHLNAIKQKSPKSAEIRSIFLKKEKAIDRKS
jgi:hypothetical protein